MSQELIAIISAAIVLAGIIVTGQWGLRRDIAALGERVGKVDRTMPRPCVGSVCVTEAWIEA